MNNIEYHPVEPFMPGNAQLLMLGSFPPPKERWSMDFFYPNFQNDMWRIFGYIYFKDKDYFLIAEQKAFDKEKIKSFLIQTNIAITDTANAAIRHKGNASDNFLEIIEVINLKEILDRIPHCNAIVTTGQKASETLASIVNTSLPKIGDFADIEYNGRQMRFYRMPSSSRAYPKPLVQKAEIYQKMLEQLNLL